MHFSHKHKLKLSRPFWVTFFFSLGDILLKPSGHPELSDCFISSALLWKVKFIYDIDCEGCKVCLKGLFIMTGYDQANANAI